MLDDAVHLLLALDKVLVQRLLREAGLSVISHVEFDAADPRSAFEYMEEAQGPCVVKPAEGTSGGQGVTCGIDSLEAFKRAVVWARRWDRRVLIETQATGEEYRFLFLDGELLGIVRRRPPVVVGDGKSCIMDLISAENQRRADGEGWHGMPPLVVDLDCVLTLQRAGLSLRSVLADGEAVRVKSMVNHSGAAETDAIAPAEVAPELLDEVARAVRAVGLRLASVEVVTPDPSRSLRAAGGVVLEVNGAPGLHYHYVVSEPAGMNRVAIPILTRLLEATG
jgi:cyanophycin synthetase